jgi:hypothetical protein
MSIARSFEQAWPSLPYNGSRSLSRCSKAYAGSDVSPSIANTPALLRALAEASVEFMVVGGAAAVMLGAPITTQDLDIVHRRTPDNIGRLLELLTRLDAYHRLDLAGRRLPPKADALAGRGHLNLQTTLGPLDVLCELGQGEGYDELLPYAELVDDGGLRIRVLGLAKLIEVKAKAGRPKDKVVLPLLVAALEEQQRNDE